MVSKRLCHVSVFAWCIEEHLPPDPLMCFLCVWPFGVSGVGLPGRAKTSCYSIGDWYPERSIFQILIALTSGEF
jgi:hypothetical protein